MRKNGSNKEFKLKFYARFLIKIHKFSRSKNICQKLQHMAQGYEENSEKSRENSVDQISLAPRKVSSFSTKTDSLKQKRKLSNNNANSHQSIPESLKQLFNIMKIVVREFHNS